MIDQGEGGEQGDALMPCCTLGPHGALLCRGRRLSVAIRAAILFRSFVAASLTWSTREREANIVMPMLYAVGQRGALESIQDSLHPDAHLFAYLDDL